MRRNRLLLLAAGLASGVINILALTGSVYMLEVYNRVLPSRSVSLLAVLTLAMLGLYAVSGALDFFRARLIGEASLRVDRSLSEEVFAIQLALPLGNFARSAGSQPMRDLDQIRTFLSGPAPTAFFDMPWLPVYLGAIYLLHPALGLFATAGSLLLLGLMLLADKRNAAPAQRSTCAASKKWSFAASACRNAEAIRAMGFEKSLRNRWSALNARHLEAQARASLQANGVSAAIKVVRAALQSGILGLGAYLVLNGSAAAGTMVAASIVLSRALAPVETAITHWRSFVAARQCYARLSGLLAVPPLPTGRRARPSQPHKSLAVERLSIVPPRSTSAVIRDVSFALAAGDGLGVIGPSASGKSSLARALVGVCQPRPQQGCIRLDGVPLCDWITGDLGHHIGYLPQNIQLIEGSIADNISRFDPRASIEKIAAAARAAGIEQVIERLPEGYRTQIDDGGSSLSAGQRQRIGLARALYGDPFLVVLDEPNANLDAKGDEKLTEAIAGVRRRGGIAVVITHRRTVLAAVDAVLALAGDRVAAYGRKEDVLAKVLQRRADQSEPARTRRIEYEPASSAVSGHRRAAPDPE